MTKGNQGQTCAESIKRRFVGLAGPLSYSAIYARVRPQGNWSDVTIRRYLMSSIVSLVPALYEWPHTQKFLFLRADGQYEIYDKDKHPKTTE